MLRYLREAFWARPALAGLGRVPWNALIVAGAIILGFGEHAIWPAAAGMELLYLYAIATNARFQNWVDSKDLQRVQTDSDATRQQLIQTLGTPARQRISAVEEKCGNIERLYRDSQTEDFLFEGNREALQKLTWLYIKLLVAQRNLQTLGANPNESELQKQIAAIERDLGGKELSPSLRESKQATLQIVKQRLRNLQRRAESLAEIDSDLTRIEAQIDLAMEDASLKGRPQAISANIDLVSHLLDDNFGDVGPTVASLDQTYGTTTSGNKEIEN